MAENTSIIIKGARVNNLKNIDVEIPRNKLVVITGLSGSGKSSLAFDTLYAEGQRRYVESLSSYARQFLGRMSKPECDFIKGIHRHFGELDIHTGMIGKRAHLDLGVHHALDSDQDLHQKTPVLLRGRAFNLKRAPSMKNQLAGN